MKTLKLTCALLALAGGALQMYGQGTIVATDEIPGSKADYSRTNHSSSIAIDRDSSGNHGVTAQVGSHYLRFGGGTGNNTVREFTGWLTDGFPSGHLVRPGTYTASIDVSKGDVGSPQRDTYDSLDFRLMTVGETEIGEKTIIEPYVIAQEPNEWNTVVVSYTVAPDSPLIGERLTWAIRATFPASGNGSFGPVDNIVVSLEESGDWVTDYQELQADFDLLLGSDSGRESEGALLRSIPGDFVLQPDGLRFSPTSGNFLSTTALAVVDNYLNRQDFSLASEMTLVGMDDLDDNRVGFSVLGGPHTLPDEPFNSLSDTGFYGLVWYPASSAGESIIQVREGFDGPVLAEKAWGGNRPFAGGSVLFEEDFEDLGVGWTVSGNAQSPDLWEFGEPVGIPASGLSGVNVAATGLDQNYPASTDATLRSPVVNLNGAEQATLTFHEFTDVDTYTAGGAAFYHSTTVSLLNPSDPSQVLAQLSQRAEILEDWEFRQYPIPQNVLDHGSFIIEFRLRSDPDFGDTYAGWFVDDVAVSSQTTETYSLQADGVFDISGILNLTFTLTDADGFSDSVSAFVTDPVEGNLFGIGGRTRSEQAPTFDFHKLTMTLGENPTPVVPSVEAPFAYSFGSDEGLDAGEDFLKSNSAEWTVGGSSLQLTAASADYEASLAATRVWNFEPGNDFFLGANVTLTSLDAGASENRVGVVLFGEEDPAGFDASNDASYYTVEWTPNTATGGSLSLREGFNGTLIATTDLGGLDNPPQPVVGGSYEFRVATTSGELGDLVVTGVLLDGDGRSATVSGSVNVGATETRFGFGASHRSAENAVWDFHSLSWSESVPLPMPLDFQFGSAEGSDGDEDFLKTGAAQGNWSLESDSLQISHDEGVLGSGIPNASASAAILDYGTGGDFVVRSTVSAADAASHVAFNADGGHLEAPVTGTDLGIAGNNPRTVEAWAYARTFDNNGTVWTYGDNGPTAGVDFSLKVTGTQDRWVVNQWSSSDVFFDVPGSGDRWVHIAVVHTGTDTIVYVDGELVVQEARTLATGGTQPFRMGWWFHRPADTGLNGAIRDVRVWNEARSGADILANMNSELTGTEQGLVAYWPMNESEGTVVNDLAGGNHATFTAADADTGALPEWTVPQFGLSFLGEDAGEGYSFQWESMNLAGGGVLRLNAPGDGGSVASVELASVAGAPVFNAEAPYTMQVNGFFNPNGSLSLSGILMDEFGGEAEVTAQVAAPAIPGGVNWFGITGRHPDLNWHSFEMGTPVQLGVETPPPPAGSTYADWRAENFDPADAGNDEISGPLAMPVGDGVSNLLKYAFGIAPMTPVTFGDLTTTAVVDGQLQVTYRERTDAQDIEYVPEMSELLVSWSDQGVVETNRIGDSENAEFELVTVEATLPDGAERAFLRVLVREIE